MVVCRRDPDHLLAFEMRWRNSETAGSRASNTESGVPYTDEEINAMARKGKQRGHLPGVGRVLPGRARDVLIPPPPQCTHNSGDVQKLKKKNKYLTKQFGNASGSGGCGDDKIADDEDEEDEEDGDIMAPFWLNDKLSINPGDMSPGNVARDLTAEFIAEPTTADKEYECLNGLLFDMIRRLQRLYKSSHTAKEMTWHATGKCTEPGKMQHPVDGRAWKDFDTKYLDFAAEPRNVRLGLAADGFNPFGNLSQSYSMWPVILTTYNLPPWLCMKESSFMLTLLIPGPKSPGKDIDVYLRPLIDDLKVLWAKPGVETIDVATGLKFNMRAMVLWTINDFPARSSLSGWSGQGYKACPTCNEDTPSVRVLGKTAYVGHRRFLKKPHKWRRSLEFNGETENGDPPREFSRDAIMTQLARLPTRVKGKHPRFGGVKIKRNVLVELNWTKRSIFYELEYWSFHTLKHNLDVMHIEKNVLESILNTLLMNDKSKDTAKARQDLKSLGIRSGLWLGQNKNGKCSKPQAAYSFTPADRKKFCQFIKGVKLPDGFGSNFKHKVTDNDTNITGLKSHDCHIMMQRLLPYGLQQYLPPDVAKPLIELCLFFKQICSQTLMVDDMLKAQSKVIDILCNLELIYPPAFFDIMIHLVIHLPLEAIFGGPIRPRWMYPFERYMKKLKNYVRNKAKPEGSIAEGYVAEEALTFSSHYFRDVTTKFNRPDRNVDCPPPTCQFQVFKSLCKSIGLRSVIRIDHQELKKVIWYVLHNSPEIDTYRAKFKIEFPNKDMKEEFPGWFGKQIRQRHVDNDPGVNESSELFALACGPSQTPISVNSCVVNGVRFVVHSRDERRTTQNNGICSPSPDGEMYYGQLEQIL
ncbi:hypothetical protein Tco_1319393 [Tanacetum coccineum]